MVRIVLTTLSILILMAMFDLRALRTAGNAKAWVVYLSVTAIGLVALNLYSTLFSGPPSPLIFLRSWFKPLTGWLQV